MSKYSGYIGFGTSVEKQDQPGVWVDNIVRRKYYGDAVRITRRSQTTDHLNDDLVVSNQISIVADPYARDNLFAIRYAEFMGAKWKVTSVEEKYPRLELTLGGIFNG